MSLSHRRIESIRIVGLLHDIGKISIPSDILTKSSELSPDETILVRKHSQMGFDLLKGYGLSSDTRQSVAQHHEHVDGSGYPYGLTSDDMLIEAKIVSVSDSIDAMLSFRPYRNPVSMETALVEITKNSGSFYDPYVVDACAVIFYNAMEHYANQQQQ
jgi:HD-GYP domain-containing protein (c-di-GMP phosphodiesterase class II)